MVCSAAAFHNPEHLAVAVLCSDDHLAHWDWLKWLPHSLSGQQGDAVGPRRMVTTSLDDLGTMLPPDLSDRPRFGADEAPPTPHILLVIDGGKLPPGNHIIPPDGLHGVTLIDLPERWDELDDPTRLRLEFAHAPAEDGKLPGLRAAGARRTHPRARGPVRPGDRGGVRAPARPAAHRVDRR